MASFDAELVLADATYPVRHCEFEFAQAADQRGRMQAKVRHGLLHLTLDVPTTDQLLDWAATPHKPLAGHLTFFNADQRTPRETVSFSAGKCVGYAEVFVAGSDSNGAYTCQLTIASEKLELAPGGPALALAPAAGLPTGPPLPTVAAAAAVAGAQAALGQLAAGPVAAAVAQVIPYAGFGGDIITHQGLTTTVLGKFQDPVLPGTGTSVVLQQPEGSFTRGEQNPGGLNILDIPTAKYEELLDTYGEEEGKQLFWENHNLPFLHQAFAEGHEVRLLSDPASPPCRTGFYARELSAIEGTTTATGQRVPGIAEQYGYRYSPATASYLKAVTPPT